MAAWDLVLETGDDVASCSGEMMESARDEDVPFYRTVLSESTVLGW